MAKVIKLAGQEFTIVAPAFGNLRKVIASVNKMQSAGGLSDDALGEAANIIALMVGKSLAEVEAMPITIAEIAEAMNIIPEVCGLVNSITSGEVVA